MLELAYKHVHELNKTYLEYIDKLEYKHFNRNGYTDLELEIDKDNWKKYQYVSVASTPSGETEVIGFFEAERIIATGSATICAIHFGYEHKNKSHVFAADLKRFIKLLFEYKQLNKIEIRCRTSNPSMDKYFRLIPKIGGRYVGIKLDDGLDEDRALVDVHEFEIHRDGYFRAIHRRKSPKTNFNIEGYFRAKPVSVGSVDETKEVEAPPLGIMPAHMWDTKRLYALKEAVYRYEKANKSIPKEWVEEITCLSRKLNR